MIISLGFIVARFGVWLRHVAGLLGPQMVMPEAGAALPVGVAMVAFGGVSAVLAAWRHHALNRAIRRGEVDCSLRLVAVVLIASVLIIYIVVSAEHQ